MQGSFSKKILFHFSLLTSCWKPHFKKQAQEYKEVCAHPGRYVKHIHTSFTVTAGAPCPLQTSITHTVLYVWLIQNQSHKQKSWGSTGSQHISPGVYETHTTGAQLRSGQCLWETDSKTDVTRVISVITLSQKGAMACFGLRLFIHLRLIKSFM